MRFNQWHLFVPNELGSKERGTDEKHRNLRHRKGFVNLPFPIRPDVYPGVRPQLDQAETVQDGEVLRDLLATLGK
jgi:hypothetical protein